MGMQTPTGYSYLASHYPDLARRLPRVPLAHLPTPLERREYALGALWIKHDDATHPVYGGNKVRKLEYLLGAALQRRCSRVVTFGGVGSNHALATAIHATGLGLDCHCILGPQPNTPYLADTLRRHQQIGTGLWRWPRERAALVARLRALRDGAAGATAVIPLGGTSWTGSVGYVNAAFELAAQLARRHELPPDEVYLPIGTMGTVAGLATGFALLDWPTRITAVRVVAASVCNEQRLARLCDKMAAMIGRLDWRAAGIAGIGSRISLRHEFLGEGYACPTEPARRAIDVGREQFGLTLETTYSGKAMAALLSDREAGRLHGRRVLFWQTYSGPARVAPIELDGAHAALIPD
jgi:D-cysteine desulfhydrase